MKLGLEARGRFMAASRLRSFVPGQRCGWRGLPQGAEPRVPLPARGVGHPRSLKVGLLGGQRTSFFFLKVATECQVLGFRSHKPLFFFHDNSPLIL